MGNGSSRNRLKSPIPRVAIRWLFAIVVLVLLLWSVVNKKGELIGIGSTLRHIRWEWVILGILAEVASYWSFSKLSQQLLDAGKLKTPLKPMVAMTLVSTSMQYSLPGGVFFSTAWAFRRMKQLKANDALASWVIVMLTALSFVTLAILAGIGLLLAFGTGSGFGLVTIIAILVILALVIILIWINRRSLFKLIMQVLQSIQRHRKNDKGTTASIETYVENFFAISPSTKEWLRSITFATGNWIGDMACLTFAFFSINAAVPWRALLLAYCGGQLASNIPITPGGLGVVEGSLAIALVLFGGDENSTAAAVLIYRVISFWLVIILGWSCWGAIAISRQHVKGDPTVNALDTKALP